MSGFRVRMRTVFVPYVLVGAGCRDDGDGDNDDRDRKEAGTEERTVVLCVEVENTGEAGAGIGFRMEGVDVKIGGEGAGARLIGWGDMEREDGEENVFPLTIGSMEQVNLLYAVSFLRSPDDEDAFSFSFAGDERSNNNRKDVGKGGLELQRAVTINIHGKPFVDVLQASFSTSSTYPTPTFSSRWNCILDLSPQPHPPVSPSSSSSSKQTIRDALPEPASPFPMSQSQNPNNHQSPRTVTENTFAHALAQEREKIQVAGSKRHAQVVSPSRALRSGGTGSRTSGVAKAGYVTPAMTTFSRPSSAGYGRADSPGSFDVLQIDYGAAVGAGSSSSPSGPLATPAYPAYPSPRSSLSPSPAPHSHVPVSGHNQGQSNVGVVVPSVEIRRERGTGMAGAQTQSPMPMVMGVGAERGMGVAMAQSFRAVVDDAEGEPIVISVGLLPSPSPSWYPSPMHGSKEKAGEKIYPTDTFTLDIFVFNKSSWTRRFEVSYPDRRKRRKQVGDRYSVGEKDALASQGDGDTPGILPLQNRVRIG